MLERSGGEQHSLCDIDPFVTHKLMRDPLCDSRGFVEVVEDSDTAHHIISISWLEWLTFFKHSSQ